LLGFPAYSSAESLADGLALRPVGDLANRRFRDLMDVPAEYPVQPFDNKFPDGFVDDLADSPLGDAANRPGGDLAN
jgi:hypothetical protein